MLSHAPVLQLSLFFDWSLAATLAALVVGRQFSPAFLLLPLFLVSGVVAVVSPAAVAPRPLPCSSNDEHGRLHSAITFFGCGIFYPIPASGTQFFFFIFYTLYFLLLLCYTSLCVLLVVKFTVYACLCMCMLFLLLCRLSDCNWCTVGRYRGRYRCSHYCTTPHCPILPSPSHHTKCCRSPVHNYRTMQYDSGIKRSTDGIERQPQHCCKRSATARQPHNAQTSAYFTQILLASTNVLETKKNVAKWSDDWPNNVYNCTSNFWFNQTIERMFILSSRWNDFFSI